MAVKNTLKGGTDWADGDILFAADLNDTINTFYTKVYADNTGGSIASSTTETDLATITVLTADFNSGSTSIGFLISTAFNNEMIIGATTLTYRLYVNGVVVKTVIATNLNSNLAQGDAGAIVRFDTGNDLSSSNVIVKVTGQSSINNANNIAEVTGLTVMVINDNS